MRGLSDQLADRMHFSPACSIHPIDSDGNCQWKALSWACFGDTHHHVQIRNRVCNEIRTHWSHYKDFVVNADTYVHEMSKIGTWGDHCTLVAFCNVYDQHLLVMRNNQEPIMVQPASTNTDVKASQWIVVVYNQVKNHYSSVYPYYASPTGLFLGKVRKTI